MARANGSGSAKPSGVPRPSSARAGFFSCVPNGCFPIQSRTIIQFSISTTTLTILLKCPGDSSVSTNPNISTMQLESKARSRSNHVGRRHAGNEWELFQHYE